MKSKTRDESLEAIDAKVGEKLLEAQRKLVEAELEELKDGKKKGKCAVVFKMKAKVTGEKKEGAEAVAIKDPDDGSMLYEPDEIKSASLKYCQDLLKDSEPDPEFSSEVEVKKLLHEIRMSEHIVDDDHEEFTKEDFDITLKKLKTFSIQTCEGSVFENYTTPVF